MPLPAAGYSRQRRRSGPRARLRPAVRRLSTHLQIESAEGLENAEAIASLPGVDMLFIGPSDLSSTIGHHGDPGHAEVAEAIARIESAAASAGILVGSILLRGRSAAAMARDGYALVVADSDITLLRRGGCQWNF